MGSTIDLQSGRVTMDRVLETMTAGADSQQAAPGRAPIGSTAEEMQFHYDSGNEFFALWLDRTMSYSSAMFEAGDSLERAQTRKLDHHIANVRLTGGMRLLDIGSGWGGLMARAVETCPGVEATGLTVAQHQVDYTRRLNLPTVRAHQIAWTDFEAPQPFDAIISIGAFEHFGRAGQSRADKLTGYRLFFQKCHDWLRPGGFFSLQSVAYGNMAPEGQSRFLNTEIFPASELPSLAEIAESSRGLFEIKHLRNDRLDYAETNRRWLNNLRRNRVAAEALVGTKKVADYLDYLRLSVVGFHIGNTDLHRIAFQRIDTPRFAFNPSAS